MKLSLCQHIFVDWAIVFSLQRLFLVYFEDLVVLQFTLVNSAINALQLVYVCVYPYTEKITELVPLDIS